MLHTRCTLRLRWRVGFAQQAPESAMLLQLSEAENAENSSSTKSR